MQPNYQPTGTFHIFNHANGRENIFENEDNYNYFLKKYQEKLGAVVKTLAYCLLPNHFHLLIQVETPENLLAFLNHKKSINPTLKLPAKLKGEEDIYHYIVHRQFHNFLGGYSKAFNKYHHRKGSLLRQNTRRKMLDHPANLINAIRYLNLNPVHHGFTALPDEWQFSSYSTFLNQSKTSIPREEILKWFGGVDSFLEFHLSHLDQELDPLMEQ